MHFITGLTIEDKPMKIIQRAAAYKGMNYKEWIVQAALERSQEYICPPPVDVETPTFGLFKPYLVPLPMPVKIPKDIIDACRRRYCAIAEERGLAGEEISQSEFTQMMEQAVKDTIHVE